MVKKYPFTFRTVNEIDRTLVHSWLTKPHVAKWFYGDGLANTLKGIDDFIKGTGLAHQKFPINNVSLK